jgi:hypothetical protein
MKNKTQNDTKSNMKSNKRNNKKNKKSNMKNVTVGKPIVSKAIVVKALGSSLPSVVKPQAPYKPWQPYRFDVADIEPTPAGVELDTCDLDLLHSVFMIQNPSNNEACNNHAIHCIRDLLPKECTVVVNAGNMIVHKGNPNTIRPFYVAHMDQVHDYVPFMTLDIRDEVLYAYDGNEDQTGTGGDDKCGIYVAIAMLRTLENCSAVFVRDEEVGCIGSGSVPLGWFKNAAFVIQCDRNNTSYDIIAKTNGMVCASDEFVEAMLALPACKLHTTAQGSITDIGALAKRGLGVSMINLSSGYYEAHSSREVVSIPQLMLATTIARHAAVLYGNAVWNHTPTPLYPSYQGYQSPKKATHKAYVPHYDAEVNEVKWDALQWVRREKAERALAKAHVMDEFSCSSYTLQELENLAHAHNLL